MTRSIYRYLMIALTVFITACSPGESPVVFSTPGAVPMQIVFHNGTILTMEDDDPQAEAVLIQGDSIVALGGDSEILAQVEPGAVIINLKGRTIVPGFIDTHNHRMAWSIVGGDYESPEAAIQAALEQGWTGLHELDVNEELLEMLQTLDAQGQLRLRVSGYLGINSSTWDVPIGERISVYEPTVHSPYLKLAGAKIFDGLDDRELNQILTQLHNDGWQVAIEGLGTESNEMVLNAYENTLQGSDNFVYRHRIEHVVAITDEQIVRMKEMGIIASVQLNVPGSLLGEADFHHFVDREPEDSVARWRDLIEAGIKVIGNTDFPSIDIESIDGPSPGSPIRLLYRGVTRTWAEGSVSEPWMLDQAITVDQALRLMTINAAYASLEEDKRGSLAPGKLADLVILSANPLTIPTEELLGVDVLVTIVGGKIEWCMPGHESLCAF